MLTSASWMHIVSEHPEMALYRDAILITIGEPHRAVDDPRPGRQRFYRSGVGPTRWLRVVVDFDQRPAAVVTAFGFGKEHPA